MCVCTPYPVYLGSLLSAVGTYHSLSQQEPSRACCPRACLRGVHLLCGGSISQAVGISFTMFPRTSLSHRLCSHFFLTKLRNSFSPVFSHQSCSLFTCCVLASQMHPGVIMLLALYVPGYVRTSFSRSSHFLSHCQIL